jgi:hypothetical protein
LGQIKKDINRSIRAKVMVEFNPDGSLKLPDSIIRAREENEQRMKMNKCIRLKKEVVSFTAPKKCSLRIRLSEALKDARFIETIHSEFKNNSSTPTKLTRLSEKEFEIEIGSDFKRCSDCTRLIGNYKEFLYGNLIEEKGSCTFEGRVRSWSEEDYFD